MNTILVVIFSLFALGHASSSNTFALTCKQEYTMCSLISEAGEILKVQNLKCINEECRDTFLIADDDKWYVCEHETKRLGACTKLFKTNTLQLQSALLDLLIENSGTLDKSNSVAAVKEQATRALPFETLNYGRRKRYLPFETLNYGKRSSVDSEYACDCNNKRTLPFETMLYGKRALPFETLNYGKRAYIPYDGYIMGKREEQ